jgi:hypothetical protein
LTAIAGLVHEGRVYIGSDSLSGNAYSKDIVTNPKLIELDGPDYGVGPILIGFTSSWRMGQLLQHKLKMPDVERGSEDPIDYLVKHFVEGVRTTLKSGGYAETENGQESGGTFLVGYGGRLFTVQSDYSVLESSYGLDSCGSGEEKVLAVLYATRGMKLAPEPRITMALEAAATFTPTVQGPFVVKSVGLSEPSEPAEPAAKAA